MHIRVAAYAVIISGGKILLAHWRAGELSGWTLPGGGIDPGEDPADAAVREISEETGYRAELGELIGVDSKVIPAGQRLSGSGVPLHALRIVYTATVVGGDLSNEIGGSTDEAAWFALGDVAGLDRVDLVDIGIRMRSASEARRAG
ncbi:ADP-ribose pyrophosphatase YjhB, NUDIX family [Agreia bicolorata]|uniref:ADP-ribose pyrophosphatase YjhB, NUDIX family n=1 Tax=Agreia bicolorata TaxID=110935 RepID=A0A1T4YE96_9MICO|nr:NUDIX hydrolase [Agreia bicolorata]SKB00023.1 ADP-ribose pyrophosphatase YjhB, NUDIX family [Agreia bicolorata]